jgi:hypothetical protein
MLFDLVKTIPLSDGHTYNFWQIASRNIYIEIIGELDETKFGQKKVVQEHQRKNIQLKLRLDFKSL